MHPSEQTSQACPCLHPVLPGGSPVSHICLHLCGRPPGLIQVSRGWSLVLGRIASGLCVHIYPSSVSVQSYIDGGTTSHVLTRACSVSYPTLEPMLAVQLLVIVTHSASQHALAHCSSHQQSLLVLQQFLASTWFFDLAAFLHHRGISSVCLALACAQGANLRQHLGNIACYSNTCQ